MSVVNVKQTHTIPTQLTATVNEQPLRRRWLVFAVLAAVAFMAQLDLFVVNVALPDLARSFHHAQLNDLSWVLNGYSIMLAALLVPAGRLADHFGRRWFLLAGVVVFTLASVICALSPSLWLVILGRAVQGIGAAMIIPTSLGLLFPAFLEHEHNLVVGLWAGVASIAAASGPTVGGLLVISSWRLIFLINVPIGIAALVVGIRVLPEVRAVLGTRRPDVASSLALLAAVALLSFGMVQSTQWGWGNARTLLVLAGAVATGLATVWAAFRRPNAVIEASLFRASREISYATIGLFLFFVAFATWLLLTVLFLQDVWHYTALRTGVAISPGPICAAIFALNAGHITRRFGRQIPAIVGTLLVAAGAAFWLLVTPAHPDYVLGFLPGLIIAGIGVGLTQAPLFATASTLPRDRSTTGSAVLNMARQVGSAVGVALFVTLLAGTSSATLTGYHRGWILMMIACVASAATISLSRRSARTSINRAS